MEVSCVTVASPSLKTRGSGYVLDVSMHEDASRGRKSPTILSILRSFALNILRFNKVNNVADALWRNAMNLNRVLAYGGI
jgi:hypothetical protein